MYVFSRFVLKYAKIVLAAGVLLTVGSTYYASKLHIDNSMSTCFPADDGDFQQLQELWEQFGGDELIVVAYESDLILSKKHLFEIDRISSQIAGLEKVLQVTSLTTVSNFKASQGGLQIVDLIDRNDEGDLDLPEDKEGWTELRKRVLDNRLFVNNIISPEGNATAIVAHIENDPGDNDYKMQLVRQVRQIVASSDLDVRFHVAGQPVYMTEIQDYVWHDLRLFTMVVVVMIAAVLFYIFRGWRLVFLPLLTVMMCVLWTAAFMQLTSGRITIASTIVPTLLTAVGVAMVVHVLVHYQDSLKANSDRRLALHDVIARIGWPCLLTAITTALGFASLSASEIPLIIETGLFAAFGVMTAYLIAMVFVPGVLLHSKIRQRSTGKLHPYLVRSLRWIGRFNQSKTRLVVLTIALLVVISIWGVSRLEVETNMANYFSYDTDVRQAQDFVSERLGGSVTMDVVIETQDDRTLEDMQLLKKIVELEDYLQTYPAIGKVFSITDIMLAMNKERMDEERLFEDISFIEEQNLRFLRTARIEWGHFQDLVDQDFTKLRITARLRQVSSKELLEIVSATEVYLQDHFTGEYKTTLTGSSRLFAKMEKILIDGEIKGLAMAVISIFVVITLLFRNLWMGLIAMVPNIVPIAITLAVMGFAGIPINVHTAMIPCIAIGIAVDDTIHYVSRFKREFARDKHYVNSMFRTLLSTGKPIVFTSIILFCGFITLAVSNFSCNAYFGILTGITMISALLGDLIILPVLINLLHPLGVTQDAQELAGTCRTIHDKRLASAGHATSSINLPGVH